MQIDLDDATARWLDLVDRAHRGETFVITKGGLPMAQLAPLESTAAPPADGGDTKPTQPTQPTQP